MKRGSITVFLSLIILLVLTLLCTIIESARIQGIRMVFEESGQSAAESIFAGYQRNLLDEYGLMFYDGGFSSQVIQYSEIEEEYRNYVIDNSSPGQFLFWDKGVTMFPISNVEASLGDVVFATDYNGDVFINAVGEYMKYAEIGNLAELVKEQLDELKQGEAYSDDADEAKQEENSTDWNQWGKKEPQKEKSNNVKIQSMNIQNKKTQSTSAIKFENNANSNEKSDVTEKVKGEEQVSEQVDEEEEQVEEEEIEETLPNEYDEKRYEESVEDSPIGSVEDIQASGFLWLVVPEGKTVSGYTLDTKNLPSVMARDDRHLEGGEVLNEWAKKVLFREYILQYFTCFTNEKVDENVQYELEYILFGRGTDEENLNTTMNRLMWIRQGLNMMHIYLDPELHAEATALATTIMGWTLIPPLVTLTEVILIAAWAYGESLVDMRTLLSGGKVPINKEGEEWTLGLQGVTTMISQGSIFTGSGKRGLTYEDYLRLLLYFIPEEDLAYRCMDVIQINMQETYPQFMMTNQISAMEFHLFAEARPIFFLLPMVQTVIGRKEDNYQLEGIFSRTY